MQAATHPPPAPGFDADLVAQVLDDARTPGVRIYGISGLQGSGKSTLAAQVVALAATCGLHAVALSVDDFYLDHDERRTLARRVHPLLATRGPPGTHDAPLALQTLDALRAGEGAALPRFDKQNDRRAPAKSWPHIAQAELIVFEGWFLGTPAEPADALRVPVNALERGHDRDGRWRRWCNQRLAQDYPPLWARIDRLLFLQPPGFQVVPGWRWQQEQALHAASPEHAGMDRAGVMHFVQHYERISRQALRTLPALADTVIRLNARRCPQGGLESRPAR